MEECEQLNEELSRLNQTVDVNVIGDPNHADSTLISETRKDFDSVSLSSSASSTKTRSPMSEDEETAYVFGFGFFISKIYFTSLFFCLS